MCRTALALCRTPAERQALAARLRYELAHALRRRQWAAARQASQLLVEIIARRW